MEALDLLAKNMVFVKMFAFNAEFLNELARLLHPITPRVTVKVQKFILLEEAY